MTNQILLTFFLIAISVGACNDKKLNEKKIKSNGIEISWYEVSEITTIHEFVEVSKGSNSERILEGNTNTVEEIVIRNDSIVIKTKPYFLIYRIKNKIFDYTVVIDSTEK